MTPEDVLGFWFAAAPGAADYGRMRAVWFEKDAAFDDEVRRVLGPAHEAAARGAFEGWVAGGRGSLALVLLLDQVPRNIFRGSASAYASDPQARAVAAAAIAQAHDRALLPAERMFLYLPFEHSEAMADQVLSLELFAPLEAFPETAGILKTARRHAEIVERFGRFPHRNRALGRPDTREEAAFLAEPDAAF